jgi:homoserine dehydrogenase
LRELGRRTASIFTDDFDCPVSDSVEEVLATDAVDAVVVGTPTRRWADDAVTAIESGRHVLTAKPAADAPSTAEKIAHAAADTDVFVTTTAFAASRTGSTVVISVTHTRSGQPSHTRERWLDAPNTTLSMRLTRLVPST